MNDKAPVLVTCDQMEDGDQIWFPSRFEAEQTCDSGCCEILPAPDNYVGPKFYAEGDSK